jgi:hypothetical protein
MDHLPIISLTIITLALLWLLYDVLHERRGVLRDPPDWPKTPKARPAA